MARTTDTDHSQELEIIEEQLAELEKRLVELDENPEAGEPWEEVRARILASL